MKRIFEYMDAGIILEDFWEYLKTKNSKYSTRYLSRKMGYKSPVYFTRIFNHKSYARSKSEKRSLTVGNILQRVKTLFKLKGNEATFLKYLCLYTKEKNVNTKEILLDKLISLNNSMKKIQIKEKFQFHKDWYKNNIRAILGKPKSPPKIYTNTLSCSEKVHDKIIRRIEKLCSEITAMVSKDEPSERVLQFQFQLFDQYQP